MLCQKCEQRPATVFFTQTINTETTQMHLCEVCAKEQNPIYGGIDAAHFNPLAALTNILNTVMAMEGNVVPGMAKGREAQSAIDPQLQCPHCGYQLSAFRQTGRLGCTRCYESFRKALEPVITGIHGSVRHAEESSAVAAPLAAPKTTRVEKPEVEQIRAQIKEAVQNEKYEEAARLRDEIKKIEDK
jgi:protein arginine kinase activator